MNESIQKLTLLKPENRWLWSIKKPINAIIIWAIFRLAIKLIRALVILLSLKHVIFLITSTWGGKKKQTLKIKPSTSEAGNLGFTLEIVYQNVVYHMETTDTALLSLATRTLKPYSLSYALIIFKNSILKTINLEESGDFPPLIASFRPCGETYTMA